MKTILSVSCFFYCLLLSTASYAQGQAGAELKPEMADGMRSNGKIYVVVAVLLLILSGLFFYLVSLDRKISRLEKGSSD